MTIISDSLLRDITLSILDKNVEGILLTQKKILQNQDIIFDRLCDLERRYQTIPDQPTSSRYLSTPTSANPNSLFAIRAPASDWYKDFDDEDVSSNPQQHLPYVASRSPATLQPQPQSYITEQPPPTPHSHLTTQRQPGRMAFSQRIRAPLSPVRSTAAPAAQAPQQKKAKALQSDVIPKAKLVSVETVMEKYPKLKTIGNSGALAVKLARESVFGEEVLVQCTVFGARDLPDLPTEELGQLKQALFAQFPQFWGNPVHFEPVWGKCVDSINQCCKRLRRTAQPVTHGQ